MRNTGWPSRESTSTTIRTASIPRVAALHTFESMACSDHAEVPRRGYLGGRARGKMKAMPRVTVIMATYNWSSVLPYSIGSALRQSFTDFELLVVGDGCTDDSEQVVTAIGDPRVRWINLSSNSGHQSAPNNEGLRQARGD